MHTVFPGSFTSPDRYKKLNILIPRKDRALNAIHQELKYFLPQKMSLSSQKYWLGNRIHPIPGPESSGQKGTRSRSATLVLPLTAQLKPIFVYIRDIFI
jgi:hypothetical protein